MGGVPRAHRAGRLPLGHPGPYELAKASGVVEQIIRPTGLIDPEVVLKPTKGQIDDLLHEINQRAARNERVLVTTLTKKMAEDLTDYLLDKGVRVRYLHSDIDTLRRVELLRELRLGQYDVLVGINLLREGLDLPEVSLVSILDADKEGFLRSARSLIQTIGRRQRNVSARCTCTPTRSRRPCRRPLRRPSAAARSRSPTTRRPASTRSRCARRSPTSPTCSSGRTPTPRRSWARAGRSRAARAAVDEAAGGGPGGRRCGGRAVKDLPANDLANLIQELSTQMHQAAADLHFELAARLRDEIQDLKKELRQMSNATR